MALKNLMRLHAVLALIYGIGLVLVPNLFLSLLSEVELSALGANIAQVLGAALVMLAVVAWQASNFESEQQRKIAQGLWLYSLVGLIVSFLGQIAGTWSLLNWLTVALFVIWLLAYSFFLFIRR